MPPKLLNRLLLLTLCVTTNFTGANEGQHNALLRTSSSPYLQLHADNPVAWVPYTPRVIPDAEKRNKLLFLSIGYSTCHWCHVMNRESFQDEEVAGVLNTSYTAIKMDREQYPDADQYYNDLLVLSGGTAGWPLSGILLPDGTPLWLGNYLPKEKLIRFLEAFAGHFERGSPDVDMQAGIYRELIALKKAEDEKATNDATPFDIDEAGRALLAIQDPIYGGVRGAQKFPNPDNIEKLWWFYDQTGDERFKTAALRHLDGMLEGTLYDPLYGGFFRYATKADWTEPHFEKMLYTQAQMLGVYTNAFKRTGNQSYLFVAEDTYRFIRKEFRHPDVPAFIAAIDSEVLGRDGGAYTLAKHAIGKICQSDLCEANPSGEGAAYLISTPDYTPQNLNQIRSRHNVTVGNTALSFNRDLKVLVGWNAMLAIAMRSYEELRESENDRAERLSSQLIKLLKDESRSLDGSFLLRQIMSETQVEASQLDYLVFGQLEMISAENRNIEESNAVIFDRQVELLFSSPIADQLGPQLGWIVPHINHHR